MAAVVRLVCLSGALATGCGESSSPHGSHDAGEGGGAGEGASESIRWLGAEVRFADVETARTILGSSDGYTQTMSAFDRGVRMQTEAPTTEADYLAYAAGEAREWPDDLRRRWGVIARDLSNSLRGLALDLPEVIWLVQSTGNEDMRAPYTRANAIILQGSVFDVDLLLLHELFHVASRNDPELAPSLYQHIGFSRIEAIPFPEELEERRITNPDAYHLDDVIRVQALGEERDVTPFLRSSLDLPSAIDGPSLLTLLELVLLEVDVAANQIVRQDDGEVSLFLRDETDYDARAGVNTIYVLDAEEVLADNFAVLGIRRGGHDVSDFGVDRPDVLDAIEAALEAR